MGVLEKLSPENIKLFEETPELQTEYFSLTSRDTTALKETLYALVAQYKENKAIEARIITVGITDLDTTTTATDTTTGVVARKK